MIREKPDYQPIIGKTYTLFGHSGSTEKYYHTIRMLTDKVLEEFNDIPALLKVLHPYSYGQKFWQGLFPVRTTRARYSAILELIDPYLKEYTEQTELHLKTLPVLKFWDRRLATKRDQYHLYMMEIELTNRLYASAFKKADKRIALLPYCLRDFSVNCKAAKAGYDYQCKHCSIACYQNQVSSLLKKNNVEPFIWMSGNMKQLAGYAMEGGRTFAVLGIACIPELLWGMRNCRKRNFPVIGLPLNANRCIRWFGEFHPNSVDLDELEKLVSA